MRMKKLLLLLLMITTVASCSQTKVGILRSYAFSRLEFPGMVTVNERSRGADTSYVVYLEANKSDSIICNKAIINGSCYNVITSKIENAVLVGILSSNNDTASISAKPENNLWQLNLEKTSSCLERESSITTNVILLHLMNGKKIIQLSIKPIIQLQPRHYM